jgi:hypothetical protein
MGTSQGHGSAATRTVAGAGAAINMPAITAAAMTAAHAPLRRTSLIGIPLIE